MSSAFWLGNFEIKARRKT